jgi:hypothetical protein
MYFSNLLLGRLLCSLLQNSPHYQFPAHPHSNYFNLSHEVQYPYKKQVA